MRLGSTGQQCLAPSEAEAEEDDEDDDLQQRLRLREAFSELLDDPKALLTKVKPCGPTENQLVRTSQPLSAQCRS